MCSNILVREQHRSKLHPCIHIVSTPLQLALVLSHLMCTAPITLTAARRSGKPDLARSTRVQKVDKSSRKKGKCAKKNYHHHRKKQLSSSNWNPTECRCLSDMTLTSRCIHGPDLRRDRCGPQIPKVVPAPLRNLRLEPTTTRLRVLRYRDQPMKLNSISHIYTPFDRFSPRLRQNSQGLF